MWGNFAEFSSISVLKGATSTLGLTLVLQVLVSHVVATITIWFCIAFGTESNTSACICKAAEQTEICQNCINK